MRKNGIHSLRKKEDLRGRFTPPPAHISKKDLCEVPADVSRTGPPDVRGPHFSPGEGWPCSTFEALASPAG